MARAQNGSRGLSSRRAQKWETPNSRKMRRQIQRDGIGSIPEMSGIGEESLEPEELKNADEVNNSLLPYEQEI